MDNADFGELLDRLFQLRPSPGTGEFGALTHNEELCPRVEARARHVAERYNFQSSVIYDVQGPQDEGADVIVRLDGTSGPEFVCFQIKSDRELTAEKLDTFLRAQYIQAEAAYRPMVRYYVLPFADVEVGTKRHGNWKDRRAIVSRINSVFAHFPKVLVVQPEMLKTFMDLTDIRIDAFVKAVLGHDDFVLNQCRSELGELPEGYARPIATLCARFVADPFATVNWGDLVEDDLSHSADGLLSSALETDRIGDEFVDFVAYLEGEVVHESDMELRVAPGAFPATIALMHDARVRFGYAGKALVDYLGFLV